MQITYLLYKLSNLLFYVGVLRIHGTCLTKIKPITLCIIISFFIGHLSFLFKIGFVANDKDLTVLRSIVFNGVNPVLNSVKWSSICYIIDHNGSLSILIISLGNCVEPFLASSVPKLHSYIIVFYFERFSKKVNCQSALILVAESVVNIPLKYVGFSNTWVSKNNHLD